MKTNFTILYGNITQWGPQAEAFFEKQSCDAFIALEHHLTGQDWKDMVTRMGYKGWRITGAQASLTGLGGTHGGALVGVKKFISHCPLLQLKVGDELGKVVSGIGDDWCFDHIRLRNQSLSLIHI